MKKKLVKVANQILECEKKLQMGENMQENLEKIDALTKGLTIEELWEVNAYLESKLGISIDK
jgi:flagellar biosynthesis chaperone FliJ